MPAVGRAFMMAVSCTKAMLVILFFMHVKYEANWKYVLTIPAAIMSIFLMLDAGARRRLRMHDSTGAACHGAPVAGRRAHRPRRRTVPRRASERSSMRIEQASAKPPREH